MGWEALHVAIDDASWLAYTEILPDEEKTSATAFLERALGFFERHGVSVERVMTDNGSIYKSHLFRNTLAGRGIRRNARMARRLQQPKAAFRTRRKIANLKTRTDNLRGNDS